MEFIVGNYVWIIVAGVILLMAIIGYIAEKTDFVTKQKERDQKKAERIAKQKLEKKDREKEKFAKEIGNGKDLIFEEENINYPVELDKPAVAIKIPKMEAVKKHKKEKSVLKEVILEEPVMKEDTLETLDSTMEEMGDLEPTGELKIPDIQSAMQYDYNTANSDLERPLENGVLNLDAYEKDASVEKPSEEISEMDPAVVEPIAEEPVIATSEIPTEGELKKLDDVKEETEIPEVFISPEIEEITPEMEPIEENKEAEGLTISRVEPTILPEEQEDIIKRPKADTLNAQVSDNDVWKF